MSDRSSYYSSVFSGLLNQSCTQLFFVCLLGPYWATTAFGQQAIHENRSSPILPLEINWTVDLGQTTVQTPAYNASAVFVSLPSGSLRSVSLSDGTNLWDVLQPTDQAPVADDSIVIVSQANELLGLKPADGTIVWKTDVGFPVTAPVLLCNGWLIASLSNGELAVIRAYDGQELWRRQLNGSFSVTPAISAERLYVPIDEGRVVALQLRTGAVIWEQDFVGSPGEMLVLDAVFLGSTDNFLYRLSLDDGTIDWKWRTGGDIAGRPRVDERNIYFLSLDNSFRALDRQSGVQQWRVALPWRPIPGLSILNSTLVVSGISTEIRFFSAVSGENLGIYSAPAELRGKAHIVAGFPSSRTRIVILSDDGIVTGLKPGTGPKLQALAFPFPILLPLPRLLELSSRTLIDTESQLPQSP